MGTQLNWIKFMVASFVLTVLVSDASASRRYHEDSRDHRKSSARKHHDDSEDSARKSSRKTERDSKAHAEESAPKKSHVKKGRRETTVNAENQTRTEVGFPYTTKIPADLFWNHLAIYLDLKDIIACGQLSKFMKTRISHYKAWLIDSARTHFRINGITGFSDARLAELIRLGVPVIPLAKDRVDLSALNAKEFLLRSARNTDSRGYSLMSLHYFPNSISGLDSVKSLNLANCNLAQLPSAICQLSAMEELDISRNKLTTLPLQLGRLSKLRKLEAWQNMFTELPAGILACQALQFLELGSNAITSVPEGVAQLKSLETLMLSGNQLTSLPDSLCGLDKLKTLYLRRNYQLAQLPVKLARMPALETVYLYGTKIKDGPDAMSDAEVEWVWGRWGRN